MKTTGDVKLLIDLGMQPISNRYLNHLDEKEKLFSLKLGQCQITGLIQLINPVPHEELVPRYDWVTYFEPENHLDNLVSRIYELYINKKNQVIGGISFKDDSTLKRFETLGFKTWRIDPKLDLKLGDNAGVESIQAALNHKNGEGISKRNGKTDLLVIRHIWEHVYDQATFAEVLKEIIADDGYMIFEVPDCSNLIENIDYTMPWEEHLYYYTPMTFRQSLQDQGFELIDMEVVPYPYENSLVALVRKQTINFVKYEIEKKELDKSLKNGDCYARDYINQRKKVLKILSEIKMNKQIVLFGAGHTAGAFINHFSLEDFIEAVIDDNLNKQGLFMPKSRIPIRDSKTLYNNYPLCLLSVNPIHEDNIILKHKMFIQEGGEIRSICPLSNYYFTVPN